MNILITESQVDVLRRIYEIGNLVDYVIVDLNQDIKSGGPGNKPDNFGQYENWVTQRVSAVFKHKHPDIDYKKIDFLMVVSSAHNDKIRKGFDKVRKRK